jgi:hypothetical protein
MITGATQGFNGKYAQIQDSPAPSGFMQLTNDTNSVRVDTKQGTRRVWLVSCNNYWSKQECEVHNRIKKRRDKFHGFTRQVFSDENGCVSAFANYLYDYKLKKNGGRFVKLEHYDTKCPALHKATMLSLTIPAQMVVSWIEGNPVWTEEMKYTVQEGEHRRVFKTKYTQWDIDIDRATWIPRKYVYEEYVRLYKEQKRGKPDNETAFWMDLRTYLEIPKKGPSRTIRERRMYGLRFPSRREMQTQFKRIVPDYNYEFQTLKSRIGMDCQVDTLPKHIPCEQPLYTNDLAAAMSSTIA